VKPAAHILATAVHDHLVLLDRTTELSHVLNLSAGLIWEAIDGSRTVADVVELVHAETGVDRERLAADVREAIRTFRANGTVDRPAGPEPTRARPAHDGSTAPAASASVVTLGADERRARWAPVIARRLEAVADLETVGPFALAGTRVQIRTNDPDVAARIAAVTRSLPPAAEAARTVWVVDRGRGGSRRYRIMIDTELEAREADAGLATDEVLVTLNLLAIAGTPDRVLLHAGAVERHGTAIVIAGESGRGKSTLVAALVRAGFGYLTDELVVIDPATRRVEPYPKAIDLSPGSLTLLGLDTTADAVLWGKGRIAPEQFGSTSAGGRLGLIVLLDAPGSAGPPLPPTAGPPLEPRGDVDALVELLTSTFAETFALPGALDTLADLCCDTPAFRLRRVPLADAVAAIDAVLG